MSDDALRELAWDFADLTQTAQQALRSEMQLRGLGDPESARSAPAFQPATFRSAQNEPSQAPLALKNAPGARDPANIVLGGFGAEGPELTPDTSDTGGEADGPHEYTWKTLVCECDEREQAWQVQEVLRRAGIESWIDVSRSQYAMTIENPRVMVAADQLDEARQVLSFPIPPEIVELSKAPVPEFVAPRCPWCGAEDPILEAVEEGNCWLCESCGGEWADATPTTDAATDLA